MPYTEHPISHEMRLYDRQNQRLYINFQERQAFLEKTKKAPLHIRSFCLTLLYTGCRISEALELTPGSLQAEDQILAIRSLKKRSKHHVREIPIPEVLVAQLIQQGRGKSHNEFLWSKNGRMLNRSTAYRWVKAVFSEANIQGGQSCPKGLRHGYGIHAIRCAVALNLLQRWMGHSSIKTTTIYANAMGAEEREIAERMW